MLKNNSVAKKSVAALSLALLLSGPAAASVDWFVGGGVGYQNDSIKGDSYKKDSEDATYQLRGGAIVNDNHRFTGTYGYAENKFDGTKLEQHMFLVSYDYLYPVNQDIYVFGGATMGLSDSKLYGNSSTDFVWGGQVGAGYRFTEQVSVELAYRYLDQDYNERGVKLEDTQQVGLYLDYRF
ncbi:outer membrane beta-barrel protein [Aliagarivorans marinus]|uniref:outer membrane beta-barrel protein n=1 Tax=Aliagarivorans marinus TaxID=561965 RepID=UPI00040672E6|nr:outer membrane beta-barrel protein [Aliagarivorans marinus]